jgi:hypothetical protein
MTTRLDPDFLPSKTENELADLQHGCSIDNPLYILVEQEWQRRARAEQHKLNTDIILNQHKLNEQLFEKQSKLTITLAIIGASATILAALLGVWFGSYLSTTNSPTLPLPEPKTEMTISAPKLSNTQAESALTNASSPNPTLNQTTNDGIKLDKVQVNKQ